MTRSTKEKKFFWSNVLQILGLIGLVALFIGAFALVGAIDGGEEVRSDNAQSCFRVGESGEFPDYVRNAPRP